MSDDWMAHRPLTRQALIDCGWQRCEDECWRHAGLPGWNVTPDGVPMFLRGDAASAVAIENLTPALTPEPDDEWNAREWTRAEPVGDGYVCTHPAHSDDYTAAWKLYTGDKWEGQAACAEHLPDVLLEEDDEWN